MQGSISPPHTRTPEDYLFNLLKYQQVSFWPPTSWLSFDSSFRAAGHVITVVFYTELIIFVFFYKKEIGFSFEKMIYLKTIL